MPADAEHTPSQGRSQRLRRPVFLGTEPSSAAYAETLSELMALAQDTDGSAVTSLLILKPAADAAGLPGGGSTLALWELLATLGAADLTAARVVEPHLDAQAILSQAALLPPEEGGGGMDFGAGTWGVYAAEAPGMALQATEHDGAWQLSGRKPWCSLADQLDYAVVTAHTGEGNRRAFAVDLREPGVQSAEGLWISRGLAAVDSRPVDFSGVPALPIGGDNWYLERDGFAWGGIGVAAVWYGGAVAVARRLFLASRQRTPDQIAHALLGSADLSLQAAARMLAAAAADVDAGRASGQDGALLAQRVRGVVADTVERVLAAAAHGLGPGPLTAEEEHARRVADLQVYLRQHHAERDQASLGRMLLARSGEPW